MRERLQTVPSHGDSGEQGVRAAVAAVLRQENPAVGAELLFIRRSENPLDPWSGHMAFPGGRHEPSDADVLTTAMRETHEEVGLDLRTHGTLLTRLPDVPAIAKGRRLGLVISPFVFALAPGASVGAIDTTEVAETLWVPLGPIAQGEGAGMMQYDYQNVRLDLPCIRLGGGQVIWGLTHQMLSSLLSTLGE